MLIEGVVTCVGYDDFLAWSLPINKNHFDRLIIITSEDDWNTQNLASYYNVECVKTNLFKDGKFPKGKALNIGLDRLSGKGLTIIWDADIIMPSRTREFLHMAKLKEDTLYSSLRMDCVGYDNWLKHFIKPHPINEKEIYVHYPFPVSPLISKTYTKDLDFPFSPGFAGIGYFQAFFNKKFYPEDRDDAAWSDLIFALKNYPDREKRQLIPEIALIHLMSEKPAEPGQNWFGRKSARFGPIGR